MYDEILKAAAEKKVISFDIFNTLLMRMVRRPEDIFYKVGKKQRETGILADDLTEGEFAIIRQEAERLLYLKKKEMMSEDTHNDIEYTLEEIYENFPAFLKAPIKQMTELEVKTEEENCYLNSRIYQLLKEFKKRGKRVILITDMYLDKEHIIRLLSVVGIDLEKIVDAIYVSSMYHCNKRSGKLFHKVCRLESVSPDEVLHIGDDAAADVIGARKAGICSFHYPLFENLPISLFYEETYEKDLANELYSIRLLSWLESEKPDRDEIAYEMGLLHFGPVLAVFTDWLLEEAKNRDCQEIYPIMREGFLFARLLKQAAEAYGYDNLTVKELYVSRQSVFLPSYKEFCQELFQECLDKPQHSLADMFHTLGLEKELMPYHDYRDCFTKDLWKIKDRNLPEEIYDYLYQDGIRDRINENIKNQKSLFLQYLHQNFSLDKKFITCDIGYGGTIQTRFERIISDFVPKMVKHYLLFGLDYGKQNYFKGINLKAFFGTLGDNKNWSERFALYTNLFEGYFMPETGSVIRYRAEKEKGVLPVFADYELTLEEKRKRKAFQKGVIFFQKLYLEVRRQKNGEGVYSSFTEEKRNELLKILTRILELPTEEESMGILNVRFDQNDGSSQLIQYYQDKHIEECKKKGIEKFLQENKKTRYHPNQEIYWPVGIATLCCPPYFVKRKADLGEYGYFQDAVEICDRRLEKDGIKEILIYGAGEVGKDMLKALKIYGIKTKCFIDRNEMLWGQTIDGVIIYSLDDAEEKEKCRNIIIASKRYIEEIRNDIGKKLTNPVIYSFDE